MKDSSSKGIVLVCGGLAFPGKELQPFNLILSQHFLALQMPFSAITELYFTNIKKEFWGEK